MFLKKNTFEEAPEDRVRLKPIAGVHPGVYLVFLYGLVIVAILFLLLLYPGLTRPGAKISVLSEPEGAAVSIDGVYQMATPAEVFVANGAHSLTVSLPWFDTQTLAVKGRRSLLFPSRERYHVTLETPDPVAVFTAGAAAYAAWSFAGEPTATYQIPLSLSEAAYRVGPILSAGPALNQRLEAAARFASTKAGIRDLVRAKYLLDNAGSSPSPLTLLGSTQALLAYLSENPQAAVAALATVLPKETVSMLTESAWYQKNAAAQTRPAAVAALGGTTSAGGLLFQEVQPLENAVRPFSIAINAVTPASWAAFIEAVPEWRYENSADLKARGLVNEDYAAETTTATLTGVSWYAAKAYCQWLTASLADSRSEVRLPFEAEWEYGAGSGLLAPGVYEWCEDHYAPFNGLRADSASIEAIGSPERSVRGGPTVEMRASLPPDFCSPFVSFRPVIAQKGTRYE